MKIGMNLHSADCYISGTEYYALGLLRSVLQADAGNQYIVFTNQPGLVQTGVPASQSLDIIEIKHLRSRAARILWEHTRLPVLAARHKLDVLHCVSYICPVFRSRVPYVVTVHDTIAVDHPQWCKRTNALYFNLFMRAAASGASRIISVSKSTAKDLERNFHLPCSKVRTIYPGIDSIFKVGADRRREHDVRRRYNLPERYILYVGNVEPKKNIGAVLCVLSKLRARGLPHKLVLAGRRSWRCRAELAEISGLAACGCVVSAGYVDRSDLPLVYSLADVFVFPSLHEGFGFPPLEAMACGIPVVSSRCGALGETLGEAALTVEPQNVPQIADAVVSMITDQALRERHISLGLKQSRLFNWEKSAKETLSLYEEVAGAHA